MYSTIFQPLRALRAKFKDEPTWTWKHGKDNLTTYLASLGFGKGKYALKVCKDPKFKPCWWPSEDSDMQGCSGRIFMGLHTFTLTAIV